MINKSYIRLVIGCISCWKGVVIRGGSCWGLLEFVGLGWYWFK